MQAKELIRRVTQMALPLTEQIGVNLWDVEFEKEGTTYVLTITIDHENGIDIDQCETISRAIDPMLDEKEFSSLPPYTLCVSSAGLARKLKKAEHFELFIGHDIELRFYKPINGQKQIEAELVAYDEGRVTVKTGDTQTIYEPNDIANVSLTVKF